MLDCPSRVFAACWTAFGGAGIRYFFWGGWAVNNSSRGLLVAILVVVSLNLLVTSIQTGLELHLAGASHADAANQALPARYTSSLLQGLADRVIEPYNSDDGAALYAQLDDVTKNQIPQQKFLQQLEHLRTLMGRIESASYSGFRALQGQGTLTTYQLNYVVKLSGSSLPSGTLTINVIDRDTGPGIVGFFIYGNSAQ